jgi:hypothetical protein
MEVKKIVERQSGEPVELNDLSCVIADFAIRLCKHASLDMSRQAVWMEVKRMPGYCFVFATNRSEKPKQTSEGVIQKIKEFTGTEDEPKWYRYVRPW